MNAKNITIVALLLAVAYYLFFWKKEPVNNDPPYILPEDWKERVPERSNAAISRQGSNNLRSAELPQLLQRTLQRPTRVPLPGLSPVTGKWYGNGPQGRDVAIRASRNTGCSYIESPDGDYGCF